MSVMAECVGLTSPSLNGNGNQGNDDDDDLDENSNDGLSNLTGDDGKPDVTGPLLSQVNVAFEEPAAKKMKPDS